MTAKPVRLGPVVREGAGGRETLPLEAGVNVVVGLKDTGKTSWLQLISFLLGDTDPVEKSLGDALASKYDSASLTLFVGGDQQHLVERRWKEHGAKGKIFVDGDAMPASAFSDFILGALGIPSVVFPKGNPYSGSTWPNLSWRMLLRHMYREERFWNELVERQPEKELHACLLQFLGAAEALYPKELNAQVSKSEELLVLRSRKEQFEEVLQHASKDLIADEAIRIAPTRDAIDGAVARIRGEVANLRGRREALLSGAVAAALEKDVLPLDTALGQSRVTLADERQQRSAEIAKVERRLVELSEHQRLVVAELGRLERARVAGDAFKPLTVTRCPHCDQKVSAATAVPGTCFVCRQGMPEADGTEFAGAKQRVEFEFDQLHGEQAELSGLLEELQQERVQLHDRVKRVDQQLAELDVQLAPVRSAVAALVPAEVSINDTTIGQQEERVAQLLRLRDAIDQRDELSRRIDELTAVVQGLSNDVDAIGAEIPFAQMSDVMSDGVNEYLNHLKQAEPARWTHAAIKLEITEHRFRVQIGTSRQTKLGATSAGILGLAYQYALLKLTGEPGRNYPGFALIDFPLTLADKTTITDKENYLVEPFVALAKANPAIQVIVCGRSFRGLKDVNRITLKQVWSQGIGSPPAD